MGNHCHDAHEIDTSDSLQYNFKQWYVRYGVNVTKYTMLDLSECIADLFRSKDCKENQGRNAYLVDHMKNRAA